MPGGVLQAIRAPENEILFSAVSVWEIAVKASLGRVEFTRDARSVLIVALKTGFIELPVLSETAILVATLPLIHRDPFDRLLVAQAIAEPARLYTSDRLLAGYSELVVPFDRV